MSHNRNFKFGPSLLSAAYADQSQGESEGRRDRQMGWGGDVAEGSAEGARDRQLGTSYAPDAEGSAESMRVVQLGDINPLNAESNRGEFSEVRFGISGHMVSDGKRGGLSDVRSDYYNEHPLGGLREEDANLRMRGLREDDAGLRMRGLREEDSNLRMGDRGQESVQFLTQQLPGGVNYRGLGDDKDLYRGMGDRNDMLKYRNMGRNDLLRDGIALDGLREEDANLALKGVAGFRAAITLRGINGLREDDANLRMRGLREEDAGLMLKGLREEDASLLLRGIGSVNDLLQYRSMGAADFHPRFPVKVEIKGLGVIGITKNEAKIAGIFDFLKANPTWEEFAGRCQTLLKQWKPLFARINALPATSKAAVINQMAQAKLGGPQNYNAVETDYLANGPAGYDANAGGHTRELERLETYLPTLQTVVAQMENLTPGGSAAGAAAAANATAQASVNARLAKTPTDILFDYVLPATAGAVGIGLVWALLT
jgi:hypothetical protein